MLSHRLSKILAEKNVPHEGGVWWVKDSEDEEWRLTTNLMVIEGSAPDLSEREYQYIIPAYPEIALFKYAKVIWKGELFCKNCEKSCGKDWSNQLDCGCDNREPIEPFTYHTHTLADLFSSGASLEKIEEYVLSSIEEA